MRERRVVEFCGCTRRVFNRAKSQKDGSQEEYARANTLHKVQREGLSTRAQELRTFLSGLCLLW